MSPWFAAIPPAATIATELFLRPKLWRNATELGVALLCLVAYGLVCVAIASTGPTALVVVFSISSAIFGGLFVHEALHRH